MLQLDIPKLEQASPLKILKMTLSALISCLKHKKKDKQRFIIL